MLKKSVLLIFFFFFCFLFFPSKVFAYTINISFPSSVAKEEEFNVVVSASDLNPDTSYYLKVRIGKDTSSMNKGETYNNGMWLSDTSAWTSFPSQQTDASGSLSYVLKAKTKAAAEEGENKIMARLRLNDKNYDSSLETLQILSASSSPSPSLEPSGSIVISSPSPNVAKAYLKINQVKNEKGEILSSVKIYLDGIYLHHYAPEELIFCDGCRCDNLTACGFGEHLLKLEKSGYQDWQEKKVINKGETIEINAVMSFKSEQNADDSKTASLIPSSLPSVFSSSDTKASLGVWQIRENEISETSFSGQVFGASQSFTPNRKETKKEKLNFVLPLIITFSGALFLLIGSLPFLKNKILNLLKLLNKK